MSSTNDSLTIWESVRMKATRLPSTPHSRYSFLRSSLKSATPYLQQGRRSKALPPRQQLPQCVSAQS